MSLKNSFRVTATMDDILQDDGLNHGMIVDLVEQSSDRDVTVDDVPLSMTGRDDDVLRTGVLVLNGTEYGFQVSREIDDESDTIHVVVQVEEIGWRAQDSANSLDD